MDNQDAENREQDESPEPEEYLPIEEILELIDSNEEEALQIQGFYELLQYPVEESINLVIEHGIIPRCTQFLRNNRKLGLQIYAVNTLSAVAAGTADQVLSLLIDKSAMQAIFDLLQSDDVIFVLRASWMLGNIANSSTIARQMFYELNVADVIGRIISQDPEELILMHLSHLVLTLACCSHKSPTFRQQFSPFMPIIAVMLDSTLWPVISDVCFALEIIIAANIQLLDELVALNGVKRLVKVLAHRHQSYIPAALNVLAVVAKHKTEYAKALLEADAVRPLRFLLLLPPHKTGGIILSLLNSLVFRCCESAVDMLIETDVFHVVRSIIRYGNPLYHDHSIDLIVSTILVASTDQIIIIADRFDLFKPFVVMVLKMSCFASLTTVIAGINHLFEVDASLVAIRAPLFELILAKLIRLCGAADEELSARAQYAIMNYAKHFFSNPKK